MAYLSPLNGKTELEEIQRLSIYSNKSTQKGGKLQSQLNDS